MEWTHGPSFEQGGICFRLWAPGQARIDLVIDGQRRPVRHDGGSERLFRDLRGRAWLGRALSVRAVGRAASSRPGVPVSARRRRRSERGDRSRAPIAGGNRGKAASGTTSCFTSSTSGLFRLKARSRAPHPSSLISLELGVTARRDHAGQRFQRPLELGLRRRVSLCSRCKLRATGGFQVLRRGGARERNRGAARRRLQPLRSRRELPSALCARFLHRAGTRPPGATRSSSTDANSRPVRDFFIENAEYWIEEFHLDGLRFDAVHAIKDDTRPDLLDELADEASRRAFAADPPAARKREQRSAPSGAPRRQARVSTPRNGTTTFITFCMSRPRMKRSGYYAAYGRTELLGRALAEGFAYQGEMMPYRECAARGSKRRIAARRFRLIHSESRPDRQSRVRRKIEHAGAA